MPHRHIASVDSRGHIGATKSDQSSLRETKDRTVESRLKECGVDPVANKGVRGTSLLEIERPRTGNPVSSPSVAPLVLYSRHEPAANDIDVHNEWAPRTGSNEEDPLQTL